MGKGLSRDVLASTALEIVDAEGLPALSMRRLARRLDVDPMAAYRHVPNKKDLLDAVLDAVLSTVDVPASHDPQTELRGVAHAILAAIASHPRAAPLLAERTWTTPAGLALIERCLAAANALNPDPRRVATAVNATGLMLVALGIAMAGGGERDDAARFAALDPRVMPHLAALDATGNLRVPYGDVLDFWLDAVFDALISPLATSVPRSHPPGS